MKPFILVESLYCTVAITAKCIALKALQVSTLMGIRKEDMQSGARTLLPCKQKTQVCPQNPYKIAVHCIYTCNPSIEEAETDRSQKLTGQEA